MPSSPKAQFAVASPVLIRPRNFPWGENTASALAAGALWGGLAAAEGYAARLRRRWPEAAVVLTGGLAADFAARWQAGEARLEADWTLRGLAALASQVLPGA